jgi:hypothetical protein
VKRILIGCALSSEDWGASYADLEGRYPLSLDRTQGTGSCLLVALSMTNKLQPMTIGKRLVDGVTDDRGMQQVTGRRVNI